MFGFGIGVYGVRTFTKCMYGYREVVGFIREFIVQRAVPVTASDVFEGTCHAQVGRPYGYAPVR